MVTEIKQGMLVRIHDKVFEVLWTEKPTPVEEGVSVSKEETAYIGLLPIEHSEHNNEWKQGEQEAAVQRMYTRTPLPKR